MKEKIFRNYLEIKSLEDFKEVKKPSEDYSVELVNSKDFKATLNKLLTEMWEETGLSFWKLQYDKYSPKEGEKVHICNNMLNGFIQRIDDKLRPHSIGCFGVYGEPGELEQIGVMLWRGSETPPQMKDHP